MVKNIHLKISPRIWLSILIALGAVFLAGSVAYAADHVPASPEQRSERPRQFGLGQVMGIETDAFTLQRKNGDQVVVRVDTGTQFYDPAGNLVSFDDLAVDGWVLWTGRPAEDDEWIAGRVLILPEDFDPDQVDQRLRGVVTSLGESSIELETGRGEMVSVMVDSGAIFMGRAVQGLEDIEIGMRIWGGASQASDGVLVAVTLHARPVVVRYLGKVSSVDADAGLLLLHTRRGEDVTVQIGSETRFRSRGGQVQGLDDVKPGARAIVAAEAQPDGSWQAVWIGVGR